MKRICVYCGSRSGSNPLFAAAAKEVGEFLVAEKIELVYGGSNLGLMGIISSTVRKNGGRVHAIMPKDLYKLAGHDREDELTLVNTMHERKFKMFQLSDAFIALPGGFGTLDEMFEMLTWSQLGQHSKPCGFLNVAGYYKSLLDFLDQSVYEGFVSVQHRMLAIVEDNVFDLLERFRKFEPAVVKFDAA